MSNLEDKTNRSTVLSLAMYVWATISRCQGSHWGNDRLCVYKFFFLQLPRVKCHYPAGWDLARDSSTDDFPRNGGLLIAYVRSGGFFKTSADTDVTDVPSPVHPNG
eukprot:8654947-Pyramimonas_sp.AAC.1